MIKWIIKNVLKKLDIKARINGDDLTITIKLGETTLWNHTFDILQDGIKE